MKIFKKIPLLLTIFFLSVSFFVARPAKADEFKWLLCQSKFDAKDWSCNSTGGVIGSGKDCWSTEYNTQADCEVDLKKKISPVLAPGPASEPAPQPIPEAIPSAPFAPAAPVAMASGDEIRCICQKKNGEAVCLYDLEPKVWTQELPSDCAAKSDQNNLNCKIDSGNCKQFSESGKSKLISLQNEAKKKLNPVGFATGQKGMLKLIGLLIAFLMFPIGALAMIMYIYAGFLWMSGSPDNITKAKSILSWTSLGIVFSLSSYILVKFVFDNLFGSL